MKILLSIKLVNISNLELLLTQSTLQGHRDSIRGEGISKKRQGLHRSDKASKAVSEEAGGGGGPCAKPTQGNRGPPTEEAP